MGVSTEEGKKDRNGGRGDHPSQEKVLRTARQRKGGRGPLGGAHIRTSAALGTKKKKNAKLQKKHFGKGRRDF